MPTTDHPTSTTTPETSRMTTTDDRPRFDFRVTSRDARDTYVARDHADAIAQHWERHGRDPEAVAEQVVGWRIPGGDAYNLDCSDYAVEGARDDFDEPREAEPVYEHEALDARVRCEASDQYLHPRLDRADGLRANAEPRAGLYLSDDLSEWEDFDPSKRYVVALEYADAGRECMSTVRSTDVDPMTTPTVAYDFDGWVPVEVWDLDTGHTAKLLPVSVVQPWANADGQPVTPTTANPSREV